MTARAGWERESIQGMPSLAIKILISAVALWVATAVVPGMSVGGDSVVGQALTLLVVAVIFGLVNAVIKPVVKLLALPVYILTLGLATFLVNAFMLWITGQIAASVGVSFDTSPFFWAAVLGALVVSVVSFALHLVLPDED